MVDEPNNFSFIDGFMSGSAFPYSKTNLEFFLQNEINNIVTVTNEKPLALTYMDKSDFNHLHIPITSPPLTDEMISRYTDFLNEAKKTNQKVVIHCQFGQERTGILLVVYLLKFKNYKVRDAISEIQKMRPGSLQMRSSLEFLYTSFS